MIESQPVEILVDRPPVAHPRHVHTAQAACILVVAGLLSYWNSFTGQFVYDDIADIVNNSNLRHLWPPWASFIDSIYLTRPMVAVSLALNYALSGLEVWSYHAFNLLVHLLATLTLFGVIRRTAWILSARVPCGPNSARTIQAFALSVSLLWMLHPLQTEAVTYVIQRAESMMGLFFLLTLYCAIRAAEQSQGLRLETWGLRNSSAIQAPNLKPQALSLNPHVWKAASVGACALGMLCKQVMVAAPLLVLIYDRTFLAGSFAAALRSSKKYYATLFSTILIVVLLLVLGPPLEFAGFRSRHLVPPMAYLTSQSGVIMHYLRLAFWPRTLCLDYGWPAQPLSDVLLPASLVLLLLGGSAWAIFGAPVSRQGVTRKVLGFSGAWFFFILAPTSSIMALADLAVEHRMYLPLAAVITAALVAGNGILLSCGKFLSKNIEIQSRVLWVTRYFIVITIAVALGVLTVRRNIVYQSEIEIWLDVLAQRPDNSRAHFNHCRAHYNLGNAYVRRDMVPEAITAYEAALKLDPDFFEANINLGNTLLKCGQIQAAITHLTHAVESNQSSAEAYNNLGFALASIGNMDAAIAAYEIALKIQPRFAELEQNFGDALFACGRFDDAVMHYQAAIMISPENASAHNSLGRSLAGQEKCLDAVREFREALRLKPDYAQAHYNLGVALDTMGNFVAAIDEYEIALKFQPRFAEAEQNLANVLAMCGRFDDAVLHYHAALKIVPENASVHNNLGRILARQKNFLDAAREFREALRLKPEYPDAQINLKLAMEQVNARP